MSNFPKRLKIIRRAGNVWIMSEFTGEIVKPYEIKKVFNMVRDFFIY